MHYIRLLRPPSLSTSRSTPSLSLVLTITTDLGESFLSPEKPVGISVALEVECLSGEEEEDEVSSSNEPPEKDDVVHGAVMSGLGSPEKGAERSGHSPRRKLRVFELPLTAAAPVKPKQNKPTVGDASWGAGMRVLKLDAALPKDVAVFFLSDASTVVQKRIRISTVDKPLAVVRARQLVAGNSKGLIVPLCVDVPSGAAELEFPHVALRKLSVGDNDNETNDESSVSPGCVVVEEEIGESIARHVWDAGLVAVAALADTCLGQSKKRPRDSTFGDAVKDLLITKTRDSESSRPLRVLELGSGVGILGIGLATIIRQALVRKNKDYGTVDAEVTVLLTDLPEAEDRAVANIARTDGKMVLENLTLAEDGDSGDQDSHKGAKSRCITTAEPVHLAYENLDWEDGRRGIFGSQVRAGHPWDLVVLSDCTYNVDMLPALVETLSALHAAAAAAASSGAGLGTVSEKTAKPSVLLARKPRHVSEESLFTLMAEQGWVVYASQTVPLPVLDGSAEVVELYWYTKSS